MQGRVALLGDSAHAMQPNLGQGGCMAIEDGYQLAVDLTEAVQKSETSGRPVDIEELLKVQPALVNACIEAVSLLTHLACFSYHPCVGMQVDPVS